MYDIQQNNHIQVKHRVEEFSQNLPCLLIKGHQTSQVNQSTDHDDFMKPEYRSNLNLNNQMHGVRVAPTKISPQRSCSRDHTYCSVHETVICWWGWYHKHIYIYTNINVCVFACVHKMYIGRMHLFDHKTPAANLVK